MSAVTAEGRPRAGILLVEDSRREAALVLRALRSSPVCHDVTVVADGAEALARLTAGGPSGARDLRDTLGLVLLDLRLPGMSGLEVLRGARADARTRRVPIVLLTSSLEPRDIADAYDLGANSYVRKPVNFDHFAATLRALVEYWLTINERPPQAP